MIQSAALLKDLKAQLKLVQADLRVRADDPSDRWGERLQEEYAEARRRERTGHSWVVWRDNEVDQAAVAWLIALTFVRFCEDNDLLSGARIDGQPVAVGWIAGPGDRTTRAEENLEAYFRVNPTHNRRDWMRQAFAVLAAQPAGKALVDEAHNPVWTADISAERAAALIAFWRHTDASGGLVHDFTDPSLDTRFLGDLYQDLSDHARKTYALLQTPVFVEEFILDQTLTPALAEFGLKGIKLIDPTCGSGHFLLGAFQRLIDQWEAEAPALDVKERVRRAMDSIHGVDLNPFAVAIARFRLTVAGLLAMGERSLVAVPNLGFHLAIGDSLLGEFGGAPQALQFEGEPAETYFYGAEDLKEYAGILRPGQYHVVVGNPPYITVKDKALNALYRLSYKTVAGKYALSVPFMELFFRLAIKGEQGQGAGYAGQITANSFMKREFGKKLIEEFFAGHHLGNPVDLTSVIDSSGAWMPGHNFDGTPTVILIGRRRRPVINEVRVVLGVKDDPGKAVNPAKGGVWAEMVEHLDKPGFNGTYVSVADIDRAILSSHPWSLSGGGAGEVLELLDANRAAVLEGLVESIGFAAVTGDDDVFVRRVRTAAATQDNVPMRRLVEGDQVRDFCIAGEDLVVFPYPVEAAKAAERVFYPFRTVLRRGLAFGKTREDKEMWWGEYILPNPARLAAKHLIALAEVATHNHFVLDRGGKVFKQTAPVIKLPDTATEADHLALLGVLNSSTVCFWLKQVTQKKGGDADVSWLRTYQFNSTKVGLIPLPSVLPLSAGQTLDGLAQKLAEVAPHAVVADLNESPESLRERLQRAADAWTSIRAHMVFAQEELDWETYRLYGLIEDDLTYGGSDVSELSLGARCFEIALARRVADGEEENAWFERHGSTPMVDLPEAWPAAYRDLAARRLDLIESNPVIRLLEKPEFKRRWLVTPWEIQLTSALHTAILDRLERSELWRDEQGPACRSLAELADALRDDQVLAELVWILTGDPEADLGKVLSAVAGGQAVPYLAALRYKATGIEKYRAWQQVWDLQRREDAGEKVDIPVPPKYGDKDFAHKDYWQARGKLDVPKERLILYPGFGREGDSAVVLGWAGWDHKDQALALARELQTQEALGADHDLLTQLVAGLVELEPWLEQWHDEVDATFGVSAAQVITGVIDQYLLRLEATRAEVTAWEPPAPTRGRRAKNS